MNREENRKRQEELMKVHPDAVEEMKKIPGVVGVGIGLKETAGEITEEIVFKVYVKEKKELSDIPKGEVIPATFQEFKTDVVVVPEGTLEDLDETRYRPVTGGCQITNGLIKDGSFWNGTLGLICTYNDQEQTTVLLSNYHVLYSSGGKVGSKIYQPSKKDDKNCCCCVCSRGDLVGTVIKGKKDDTLDCAIANLKHVGNNYKKNVVLEIGAIKGIDNAVVGEKVRKYGRTTRLTTGRVLSIRSPFSIEGVLNRNQIIIQEWNSPYNNFSKGGDSGSVVVNEENKVIGLHYSGNNSNPTGPYHSTSNVIQNVVSFLGITIGPIPKATHELTETVSEELLNEEILIDNPLLEKYKSILEETANGRAILSVINSNIQEVLWLVNHNRECGVVWQRNKGPAFIEAYNDLGEHPDKAIPKTVDGIALSDMLTNMGDVLEKYGSDQLVWNIQNYRQTVLSLLPSLDNLNSIVNALKENNISCPVLNLIWQMLWDPDSAFFLPRVLKEGLKIDALHIDIPSLSDVHIGDLPKITMFKEPVLGYMEIELTDTKLTGLPSVQEGSYSCSVSADKKTTDISFSLIFDQLEFSGKYGVSAGGGIGGCAIATGAAILGGDAMSGTGVSLLALPGDDPADQNIEQSLWYRQPLSKHENGQLLIGAYYQNNPAIYDLVNEPGSLLAKSMKLADVHSTTQQVNSATSYYYNQQNAKQEQQGPAPEIGTPDQYASGGLPSAYALAMANQKVKNGKDPDGRYARLAQHIIHFTGSISYYQKQYPGTQPVGGSGGVLDNIAKADPDQVHAYVMENGPYPVIDLQTSEVVDYIEPQPLNREELRRAYAVKAATWMVTETDGNTANGTFTDTGLNVKIDVEMSIKKQDNDKIEVSISSLKGSIGSLHIKLSEGTGWWPGLFEKVTNWIANASFFQDILKSHINDGLNQDSVKDFLSGIINGALKKL